MILLGDEAQVEALFGLLGDNANLDARQVHRYAAEHTIGSGIISEQPIGAPR